MLSTSKREVVRFVGQQMFATSSFLSSLQFVFPFVADCADSLINCCLPKTKVVLIAFAYLHLAIHTKSTMSWREDCSVLALQSTIF